MTISAADYASTGLGQVLSPEQASRLARHLRAAARPIGLLVRHYADEWYWCVHVPGPEVAGHTVFTDPRLDGRRIVHDGWANTWHTALTRGLLCIGEDVPVVRLRTTPMADGHTLIEGAGPAVVAGPHDTLRMYLNGGDWAVYHPATIEFVPVDDPQRTRISAQGHTMVQPGHTPPPHDDTLPPHCLACWPAVRMTRAHNGADHYVCPRCGLTSGATP